MPLIYETRKTLGDLVRVISSFTNSGMNHPPYDSSTRASSVRSEHSENETLWIYKRPERSLVLQIEFTNPPKVYTLSVIILSKTFKNISDWIWPKFVYSYCYRSFVNRVHSHYTRASRDKYEVKYLNFVLAMACCLLTFVWGLHFEC